MIARYGPCIGITLLRFFRWKLELWFAPSDYSPPEHSHNDSDGEFFVLYGKGRWIYRKIEVWGCGLTERIQEYNLTGRKYFKWFSVRAGTPHGFSKGETPMIWIVIEKWKPGVKVTTIVDDFHLTY